MLQSLICSPLAPRVARFRPFFTPNWPRLAAIPGQRLVHGGCPVYYPHISYPSLSFFHFHAVGRSPEVGKLLLHILKLSSRRKP